MRCSFFFFLSKLLAPHPASGSLLRARSSERAEGSRCRVPSPTRAKRVGDATSFPSRPPGPRDPRAESRREPAGRSRRGELFWLRQRFGPRLRFRSPPAPAPPAGRPPARQARAGPLRGARAGAVPAGGSAAEAKRKDRLLHPRPRPGGSAEPAALPPSLPPAPSGQPAGLRGGRGAGPPNSPPRRGRPGKPRGREAPAQPALLFRPRPPAAPPPLPPAALRARPRSRSLAGRPSLSRGPDPSLARKCAGRAEGSWGSRNFGVKEQPGRSGSLRADPPLQPQRPRRPERRCVRGQGGGPGPGPAPTPCRASRRRLRGAGREPSAQGGRSPHRGLRGPRAPGRSSGAGPSSSVAPATFVSCVPTDGKVGKERLCLPGKPRATRRSGAVGLAAGARPTGLRAG